MSYSRLGEEVAGEEPRGGERRSLAADGTAPFSTNTLRATNVSQVLRGLWIEVYLLVLHF